MKKTCKCVAFFLCMILFTTLFSACMGQKPDFSDPNLDVGSLNKNWQFAYYSQLDLNAMLESATKDFIISNAASAQELDDIAKKTGDFSTLIKNHFSGKAGSTAVSNYLETLSVFLNDVCQYSQGGSTYESCVRAKEKAAEALHAVSDPDPVFESGMVGSGWVKTAAPQALCDVVKLAHEKKEENELVITFAGNTAFGNPANQWEDGFNRAYYDRNKDDSFPLLYCIPYFANDDYTILTYEGNLTGQSPRVADGLNGFTEYAGLLSKASVEVASVASEHANDFYQAGHHETVTALHNVGVETFSDQQYLSLETKIGKIACLSFEMSESDPDVKLALIDGLRRANREKHDIIIVNFHWNTVGDETVSAAQQKYAKLAVNYGADVVMGSHPYVMQGMQYFKEKPILYSMGNLSFGLDTQNTYTDNFLFRLKIKKTDRGYTFTDYETIPVVTGGTVNPAFMPGPVSGARAEQILGKLKDLSSVFENPVTQFPYQANKE